MEGQNTVTDSASYNYLSYVRADRCVASLFSGYYSYIALKLTLVLAGGLARRVCVGVERW